MVPPSTGRISDNACWASPESLHCAGPRHRLPVAPDDVVQLDALLRVAGDLVGVVRADRQQLVRAQEAGLEPVDLLVLLPLARRDLIVLVALGLIKHLSPGIYCFKGVSGSKLKARVPSHAGRAWATNTMARFPCASKRGELDFYGHVREGNPA